MFISAGLLRLIWLYPTTGMQRKINRNSRNRWSGRETVQIVYSFSNIRISKWAVSVGNLFQYTVKVTWLILVKPINIKPNICHSNLNRSWNGYHCFNLTHWGKVTHTSVSNLSTIGQVNGLSPGRRQAITRTNAGILLIWPLGTNFSEILIKIPNFSFK